MGYSLQVFVSSTCYELRDLRAAVKSWLDQRCIVPMMSEEGGFPHIDGMPPYATCLRTLEECPLAIVIIDRQYGQTFDDWGPYPQYSGLSPTHAEILHALDRGKRALIYVQADTLNFYEVWRKDSEVFKNSLPNGLNEATLKMIHELKTRKPAPWIERFTDVTDVLNSLNRELVNQLYLHLHDRQKQTIDLAAYLLEKISEAAPEVRKKIEDGLNPILVVDRDTLQRQLVDIEIELKKTKDSSKEKITALEHEKADAQTRLDNVEQQLINTSMLIARAAMKDASWLDFIRKTMMPKQPGRVPFHNSAEVALRGYHTAGGREIPILLEVTWSKLQYNENGLHRGYNAGIIFKGTGFVPGITCTHRRRGEVGPPAGNNDYFWHLPNIYFGDYLEVSTNDDEVEAPLSWRDYEFQVKNPEGEKSEWVLFNYPFDYELLKSIQCESFQLGNGLLAQGKATEAVEPLRKAYVFADRLLGIEHEETLRLKSVWEQALNEAALARLRFRTGDRLTVLAGPHAGKVGVIKELLLNHLHAYLIKSDVGDDFQASDAQVEREQLD